MPSLHVGSLQRHYEGTECAISSGMSLFCLVHGSAQGVAGWDLLARELSSRGHNCVLPGLPADTPEARATAYARVIADAIPAGDGDAIVVAHSASGMFLPFVPAFREIRRMVFLAAVVPGLGLSILDQVKADGDMLNPEWMGKNPMNDDVAINFLFHDCSPEVAQWALTTRRLTIAKRAMIETCPLESWPSVSSTYIVCGEDRTIQPQWSRRVARDRLGVDAIELPGGHCPHVSRPAALADVLIQLSG